MRLRNALMQLLAQNLNSQQRQPLTIQNNEESGEATIFIYDAIGGYFGIDAEDFAKQLMQIEADTINLRVNSPGGDVFDARAMQTAIAQHPAKVIAHIDGMAASAATYLCAPCDEVIIAQGAGYMIHEGWTVSVGNKNDHAHTITRLEQVDAAIAKDYANITNSDIDLDQIVEWMKAETWFTADEAVEHGFANSVFEYADVNDMRNTWNVAAYENVPEWLTNSEPPQNSEDDAARAARLQRASNERRFAALMKIGA